MLLILGYIDSKQWLAARLHFASDKVDTKTKHGLDMFLNPKWREDRIKAKLLKGKLPFER